MVMRLKPSPAANADLGPAGQRGATRAPLLALVCFVLGIAASAFWFYNNAKHAGPASGGAKGPEPAVSLSERTKAILSGLGSPVEIRFYALLDPASTSEAERALAERVDRLLAAYETQADGKVRLTRYNSQSDQSAAAKAANADGIRAFNIDKGDACYFGLTVARGGRKETLPHISPDWETALESDISRAIEHIAAAPVSTASSAAAAPADTATIEQVKHAITNLSTVTIEEGTRMLREASLNEIKAALADSEKQIQQAQQRLVQAQQSGTPEEQHAALKQLQQLQAQQADNIRQIAARTQAQVEALKQIKTAPR